jgi:hypothetical protein
MRVETSRTKNAVQNSISGLISASFDESEGPQKKKKPMVCKQKALIARWKKSTGTNPLLKRNVGVA